MFEIQKSGDKTSSSGEYFQKLKIDAPKVPKQAEAKMDGVINPQNYNFSQF